MPAILRPALSDKGSMVGSFRCDWEVTITPPLCAWARPYYLKLGGLQNVHPCLKYEIGTWALYMVARDIMSLSPGTHLDRVLLNLDFR